MPEVPAHTTATFVESIDANIIRARSLAAGLSRAQFTWQPAPGVWSIGQNLGHLIVVDGGAGLESLRTAIAEARASGRTAPGPFRCGTLSAKFVASQAPPVTRKFKAPKAFHAPPDLAPDSAFADYFSICADLRALVESAAGLDLARIRPVMPLLPGLLRPFVKVSLVARLSLLTTHDSRHLWQIEQIRRNPQFPR